jgi:YHS domain-containing protein
MKSILLTCVACAVLVFGLGAAGAVAAVTKDAPAKKKDDAKTKPINTKCPLTDEDIDPKVTTVQDGKVVAFCCESCIADFKKDSAKYMKKIAADNKKQADDAKKAEKEKGKGEQPAAKKASAVNANCVVHAENAVDPTVTTLYKGKTVGFCCEDCQKAFDLDPAAYAAKLK